MNLTEGQLRANIAEIRAGAALFLLDRCTIKRNVGETPDFNHNPIYEDEPDVPCRWIVRSGTTNTNLASQERATQQTTFVGLYRMQLPLDTIVNENDRVLYADENGITRLFEIIYVPPVNPMMASLVITLQEIS